MNLVYYGDPRLSQPCVPMEQSEVDLKFRRHIQTMTKKMKRKNGVGLSAPQIGDMRRYFIFGKKTAINPVIVGISDEKEVGEEGCLSTPNIYLPIKRYKKISVRYRDLNWKLVEEDLSGFEARIFQHEFDHLDGVMFLDRAEKEDLANITEALKKVEELYGQ